MFIKVAFIGQVAQQQNYLGDNEMDMDTLKDKLRKIGYKSPSEVSKALGCPDSFCEFIDAYSGQELSSSFRLYSSPISYEAVYAREIKALEGMLIFASDIGDYLYAFDTKNNWEVVDIDTDGEVFERYGNFETFMNTILDEIIESNS